MAAQSVDGAERGRIEKLAVDVTALLAGVVARLRVPLLLVSLAPVLPGLAVEAIAIATADSVAAVLGLIGLVPAVWLTVRRIQLGRALQPPDAAVADLRRTFSVTDIADQLKDNLLAIRGVPGGSRPSRLPAASGAASGPAPTPGTGSPTCRASRRSYPAGCADWRC